MTRKPKRRPPPAAPPTRDRARPSTVHRQSTATDRRPRAIWLAVASVALVLLLTMDDRYAGAISDGRQMAWTAIAIVETGEIGQARGRDFTWPRDPGDAVSRFGMGMSLAQLPAAWLAPAIEARLGRGASQPLFLVAPLLFVCAAAAAAGWIALNLGLTTATVVVAVLLASVGSPLGAYAALDLSEPLQAAALTLAVAAALASAQTHVTKRRAWLYAVLAGFAAGVSVLTKSSLAIAVPFALAPMLAPAASTSRRRRFAGAAAGLTIPLAAWAYFEISRFGRLFASYAGEGFTHPFGDGLWRLLVGPNRGFLLYVPALLVAAAAAVRCTRSASRQHQLLIAASLGTFSALLALASGWWAWHGLWGWGPRLLVPAIPLVAASAALLLDRWPALARNTLLAVSVAANLPGLLQNAAPVTVFASACEWPAADRRFAQSLAPYARREAPDGTYRVAPDQLLETVPAASPFAVFPWFARAASGSTIIEIAQALDAPPWTAARPDIACGHISDDLVLGLVRRPGWPVWGRGFWPDASAPGFPGVYGEGLLDQVIRAQQLGRAEQSLVLARRLAQLAPGEADALILEGLRLLRRRAEAVDYLSGLTPERRSQPKINVVLALFERDGGNDTLARNLLGTVAASFPGTPAARALTAPLDAWPRDLASMTSSPTDQVGGAITAGRTRR